MPNTRDSYSEEIMPDSATDGINGFNDKIIAEFRANGGRVSGSLAKSRTAPPAPSCGRS
jgi:hypothetical protein